MNLDDVADDDDNESLLGTRNSSSLLGGTLGQGPQGLFAIKESTDRGLADMETGSEVYMSELLVRIDMNNYDRLDLTWKTLMRLRNRMKRI